VETTAVPAPTEPWLHRSAGFAVEATNGDTVKYRQVPVWTDVCTHVCTASQRTVVEALASLPPEDSAARIGTGPRAYGTGCTEKPPSTGPSPGARRKRARSVVGPQNHAHAKASKIVNGIEAQRNRQ